MLRLLGAIMRAALVLALVAVPALLLPGVSRSALEIALIVGALGAIFALVEYSSSQPGLVDFRFAPPYNRGLFVLLSSIVIALVFLLRSAEGMDGFAPAMLGFADGLVEVADFPYSPVRIAGETLGGARDPELALLVRRASALAFTLALGGILFLSALLWLFKWPQGRDKFNLWVNLPTFVPASGRQVERRLIWGGLAYVIVGFTLPLTLVVLSVEVLAWFQGEREASHQTLLWLVTLWSFLPAGLVVRGAALMKVGWLVKRARRF